MAIERIEELEILKDKIKKEYADVKNVKLVEANNIESEMNSKLAEIEAEIRLIKNTEEVKAELKKKIEDGVFTSEDYANLLPEHQALAIEALFDFYSKQVNAYHSLSAVEFSLIAIAKLFVKCIDLSKLTAEEKAFLDVFMTSINNHPLNVTDSTAWELQHVDKMLKEVIDNRNEYLLAKRNITGSI